MNNFLLHFFDSVGFGIIQSIWQGSILFFLYKAIVFHKKNISPAVKSSIGLLAVLLQLLLFVGSIFYSFFTTHSGSASTTGEFFPPAEASGEQLGGWLNFLLTAKGLLIQCFPVLGVLYLLLIIAGLSRFYENVNALKLYRNKKSQKAPIQWRLFSDAHASLLGIHQKVEIWLSEIAESPVTIGLLKPVILIPVSMVNQLSPIQMEAVILHELAHIYRKDYLSNWILNIVETILFFHPLVKMMGKEIRQNREFACDDLVLQFPYSPREYAHALVLTEKNRKQLVQQRLFVAFDGNRSLLKRIQRMPNLEGLSYQDKSPSTSLIQRFTRSFTFIPFLFCLVTALGILFNWWSSEVMLGRPKALTVGNNKNGNSSLQAISKTERLETSLFFLQATTDRSTIGASNNSSEPSNNRSSQEQALQFSAYSVPVPALSKQKKSGIVYHKNGLSETEWEFLLFQKEEAEVLNSMLSNNVEDYGTASVSDKSKKNPSTELNNFVNSDQETIVVKASTVQVVDKKATALAPKGFTFTMKADSSAVLVFPSQNQGVLTSLDLGPIRKILQQLNWEKIAHLQSLGAPFDLIMEQELAYVLKDIQWIELKKELNKAGVLESIYPNDWKNKSDSSIRVKKAASF